MVLKLSMPQKREEIVQKYRAKPYPEVSDSAGLGRSLEVCVSSTFRPRGCGPAVPGLLLGAHDYGEGRKERKANMRQPSGVARLGMYGPPGPA